MKQRKVFVSDVALTQF